MLEVRLQGSTVPKAIYVGAPWVLDKSVTITVGFFPGLFLFHFFFDGGVMLEWFSVNDIWFPLTRLRLPRVKYVTVNLLVSI